MSMKFLDSTGVNTLWNKIKSMFASKEELNQKANISDLSNVLAEDVVELPIVGDTTVTSLGDIKEAILAERWLLHDYTEYNKGAAKPFKANTVEMTYTEALKVIESNVLHGDIQPPTYTNRSTGKTVLTDFMNNPSLHFDYAVNAYGLFRGCSNIEVLNFSTLVYPYRVNNALRMFQGCDKLHTIIGHLEMSEVERYVYTFHYCYALQNVLLDGVKVNISFEHSPLLSLESIENLIDNAANTSAITVTVHPDVYSKIMDSTNTEWHQLLTKANAKNISFADGSTTVANSLDDNELNYSE